MLVELINLDTPSAAMAIPNDIKCAEYIEIDEATGAVIGRKPASTARCRFFDLQVGVGSASTIELKFEAAVNNPLQFGSFDIDMSGIIRIDRAAKTITVESIVDSFPAFESWVTANGGTAKEILSVPPAEPSLQAGSANRRLNRTVPLL